MTRDQAIEIARQRALNTREGHGYLPVTDADAATWMPHEWVVDSILWAAMQRSLAAIPTCTKCGYRVCHEDCGVEDYDVSPDTQRLLTALDGMPIIGYVSSHSRYFNADKGNLKFDDFESAVSLVRQSDALREIDRLRQELRIKSEEHDCCSEDIQRLRAAVIGILEIETERIKTGAFKPNPEAQRRIDAAWAAL